MTRINRNFLGREGDTTVITFSYPCINSSEKTGEVFLCIDAIVKEAKNVKADLDEYIEQIAQHVLESLG